LITSIAGPLKILLFESLQRSFAAVDHYRGTLRRAKFEKSVIQDHVKAGLERTRV